MSNARFSFGSDPEFCLVDNKGTYISAIEIVPGTKAHPVTIGKNLFFWDNVLAECSIDYGLDLKDTIEKFRLCFKDYAKMVHPLKMVPQASHEYSKEACACEEARTAGCMEELNCYEMMTVLPPCFSDGSRLRTGGGHVHLGRLAGEIFPLQDEDMGKWWMARFLDVFLGLPSILFDTDPTSATRRKVYGGAGNVRMKEYGLEYRTLSNDWLSSPRKVALVWNLCEFTLKFVQANATKLDKIWEPIQAAVRVAINDSLHDAAKELFDKFAKNYKMPSNLVKEVKLISEIKKQDIDFYSAWGIGS